jgi:receptor protein-tyrosine kinase
MNMLAERINRQDMSTSIGAILVDSGRITPEEAEQVLRIQKDLGIRFGDAAIQLGLLNEEDIRQALARQYDYPYLPAGDQCVDEEVVAAFQPFGPAVEQIRILRSQLMLRWFGTNAGHKTLAVVGAGRGEGRSFIAANLAVVFSQLGERTLLIDADLRHPRQHSLFRLQNRVGLSSILSGRADHMEAIVRIGGLVDLSVLPAGAAPPNPQELLSRAIFPRMLEDMRKDFDVVIIDTPAANECADYQTIAKFAEGAVVITRKDVTIASRLLSVVAGLQYAGVALTGTVLNQG